MHIGLLYIKKVGYFTCMLSECGAMLLTNTSHAFNITEREGGERATCCHGLFLAFCQNLGLQAT